MMNRKKIRYKTGLLMLMKLWASNISFSLKLMMLKSLGSLIICYNKKKMNFIVWTHQVFKVWIFKIKQTLEKKQWRAYKLLITKKGCKIIQLLKKFNSLQVWEQNTKRSQIFGKPNWSQSVKRLRVSIES